MQDLGLRSYQSAGQVVPLPLFTQYGMSPDHAGAVAGCVAFRIMTDPSAVAPLNATAVRRRLESLANAFRTRTVSPAPFGPLDISIFEDFLLVRMPADRRVLVPLVRECARVMVASAFSRAELLDCAVEVFRLEVPLSYLAAGSADIRLGDFVLRDGVSRVIQVADLGVGSGGRNAATQPCRHDVLIRLLEGNATFVRTPIEHLANPAELLCEQVELTAFDPAAAAFLDTQGPPCPSGTGMARVIDVIKLSELLDSYRMRGRHDVAISIQARSLEYRPLWDEVLVRLRQSPELALGLIILLDFEEEVSIGSIAETVDAFRTVGCRIGLEGFGFSTTVRHAYRLAPDVILLHPFFMLEVGGHEKGAERLRHVLALAGTFASTVVATGARNKRQVETASVVGAEWIQFVRRPSDGALPVLRERGL